MAARRRHPSGRDLFDYRSKIQLHTVRRRWNQFKWTEYWVKGVRAVGRLLKRGKVVYIVALKKGGCRGGDKIVTPPPPEKKKGGGGGAGRGFDPTP